jgi:uncharacterized damage-inducible protein DinB
MTVGDLQKLYDYGYWANGKILDVVKQLTPEQFTRTVAGSYGSVRNTLVHMMSAEWGWFWRCGGAPERGPALKGDDYPTPAALVEKWKSVEGWARTFLSTLREEDLDREIEFSFGGPPHTRRLGDLLLHVAIHGVHHRGQVAVLLRALGAAPGNVDILFYQGEQAGQPLTI